MVRGLRLTSLTKIERGAWAPSEHAGILQHFFEGSHISEKYLEQADADGVMEIHVTEDPYGPFFLINGDREAVIMPFFLDT